MTKPEKENKSWTAFPLTFCVSPESELSTHLRDPGTSNSGKNTEVKEHQSQICLLGEDGNALTASHLLLTILPIKPWSM